MSENDEESKKGMIEALASISEEDIEKAISEFDIEEEVENLSENPDTERKE